MDASILDAAHRFWFGDLSGPFHWPEDKAPTWFKVSEETDGAIRAQFGGDLDAVAANDWDLEALTRTQQVGLVVYLDQFPRNLFRGSGQSFAYDATARRHADALIAGGLDRFHVVERTFLLMPLMHSEDIRDQDRCAMLFADQALKAPDDLVERLRGNLDFAFMHRALIRKFGRFPHRNADLGRESTEEEKKHLDEKGRGY